MALMEPVDNEYGPFPLLDQRDSALGDDHIKRRITQLARHDLRGRKEAEQVNRFETLNRDWMFSEKGGHLVATDIGKRFIKIARERAATWSGDAGDLCDQIKGEFFNESALP